MRFDFPCSYVFYPRPRWPSGKVSTSGPEGRRFETRFHRRPAVYEARWHIYKPYPDRTEAGNQSLSLATRSSDVVFSSRTQRTAILTKQESSYISSPFSHI
ncbi:hypothetical protein AVEN_161517-1 [Araneus ventricosus]|uniref:Uncharacterized protein n=1 Tax=Araneus ventricosus TaxID=182803 RepID=A0A4Y2S2G6_ARAVE|nr:hypothetical protein AVEN_161517-1 [Araneus ventricosus]